MSHLENSWLNELGNLFTCTEIHMNKVNIKTLFNSVYLALKINSTRRFIITEISFFQQWYDDLELTQKAVVKIFFDRGQFQFVSGGIVINDEATTHYSSIINQVSLGLKFIKMNFGLCARPLVSWQISPYGHSKEMANIMKQMDFKAVFLSHIPSQLSNFDLDFLWQTKDTKDTSFNNSILASIVTNGIVAPKTFCFHGHCQNNLKSASENFINYIMKRISSQNNTKHILLPLGCDFHFQQALETFNNFDKIIDIVNSKQKIFRVFYSTPACYLEAISSSGKTLQIYKNDFFPFDKSLKEFWIGFYSSRPNLKLIIRLAESYIQTCKMITALSDREFNRKRIKFANDLTYLSELISKTQHYDYITGNNPGQIVQLKTKELSEAIKICHDLSVAGVESIMKLKSSNRKSLLFHDCPYLDLSYCSLTDNIQINKIVNLIVFNPLPYPYTTWIYLPVSLDIHQTYEVKDVWNTLLPIDVVPINKLILNNKDRPPKSKAKHNIYFKAQLPEAGYTIFSIRRKRKNFWDFNKVLVSKSLILAHNVHISNSLINVSLNLKTNKLTIRKPGQRFSFFLSIKCYCTNLDGVNASSGVFVSVLKEASKSIQSKPTSYLLDGSLVKEIRQKYSNGIGLTIRLFEGQDNVEIEWIISGIDESSNFNREYVLAYKPELRTNKNLFTDSNGRQLIKRFLKKNVSIESNFYPITSHVLVNNSRNLGLLIHTDRSVAVGYGLHNSVELLVNRIILSSDKGSLNKQLKEVGSHRKILSVIGRNWIEIGNTDYLIINRRLKSNEIFKKPILMFKKSIIVDFYLKTFTHIKTQPRHLNILTLEPIFEPNSNIGIILLRLENLKDIGSKRNRNRFNTVHVDLKKFFENFNILEATEMNLAGDKELKILDIKIGFKFSIKPMEIVTLKIKLSETTD